ncbi:MAG: NADH-quinone oxidoreductase subunit C [Candidatus Eisenbacteria bacterium]|uniref:NADH-quinone oxidoreductase n=1 Tax=Eiseniibacteriota bacterium TaxID=2212470 RepID=A0A956M1T8_UNCEI|nr:NADH-quinone oxidoreductase subunit C [Candidatus Eisenbacteria bacterium]
MAFSEDIVRLCERFGLTELPDEGPVVERKDVVAFAHALKDELGFFFFVYCVATHYPADEKTEQPDRTLVTYRVRRLPIPGVRPTETFPFRLWVPTGDTTPSLTSVWAGADWQEREQFDLVGTVFEGHPDLRRLMMPEDWPGHPLRREYAIETQHFPWR